MMTEEYKNQLLDKLINNSITKEEYRTLELEALEDPFLFDALEGYNTKGNYEKNIESIYENIDRRLKNENSKWIYWMSAASVLIICSILFIKFQNNKQPQSIVYDLNEEKKEEQIILSNKSENEAKKREDTQITIDSKKERKKQIERPKINSNEGQPNLNDAISTSDSNNEAEDKDGEVEIFQSESLNDNMVESDFRKELYVDNEYKVAVSSNDTSEKFSSVYKGTIFDENNEVIPNVLVIQNNKSTTTGIDGKWMLKNNEKLKFVIFTKEGYESVGLYLNENKIVNDIVLKKSQKKENEARDIIFLTNLNENLERELNRYLKNRKLILPSSITIYIPAKKDVGFSEISILSIFDQRLEDFLRFNIISHMKSIPSDFKQEIITIEIQNE